MIHVSRSTAKGLLECRPTPIVRLHMVHFLQTVHLLEAESVGMTYEIVHRAGKSVIQSLVWGHQVTVGL